MTDLVLFESAFDTAVSQSSKRYAETRERMLVAVRQVLSTGVAQIGSELANRETYWLMSYYPIPSPYGGVLGVGKIAIDVTERKVAGVARVTFDDTDLVRKTQGTRDDQEGPGRRPRRRAGARRTTRSSASSRSILRFEKVKMARQPEGGDPVTTTKAKTAKATKPMPTSACPTCGKGELKYVARAGRTHSYKGFEYPIPARMKLVECTNCREMPLTPAEIDAVETPIAELHKKRMAELVDKSLKALASVVPVGELEEALHLSQGYLARARARAASRASSWRLCFGFSRKTPRSWPPLSGWRSPPARKSAGEPPAGSMHGARAHRNEG